MANMKLIEAKTISSTVNTVVFSNIPQTYTDLKFLISAKSNFTGANWSEVDITVNGGSTYNSLRLQGNGSTADAYAGSVLPIWINSSSSDSTNYYSNADVYFANYTTPGKQIGIASRTGDVNSATALMGFDTFLSNATTVINTVTFTSINGDFVAGSKFYLYGIESASSNSKATGGAIYQDSTYFYHLFGSTGIFTPTQSLTADVLVIAGGGGAGGTGSGNNGGSGGGGAGGYRLLTSQYFSNGIAYTCTVGAGGSGGASNTIGSTGGNSSIAGSGFTTITSSGGGGGSAQFSGNAANGGSGGGGGWTRSGGTGNAGGYTPVEGYAGGIGGTGTPGSTNVGGGGGGGAGGVGGDTTAPFVSGAGGIGSNTASSWGLATGTGENVLGTVYYAGGGAGGIWSSSAYSGAAGLGGGAVGVKSGNGNNATSNTGGGGGGTGANSSNSGGNGASGLVIVRYAK